MRINSQPSKTWSYIDIKCQVHIQQMHSPPIISKGLFSPSSPNPYDNWQKEGTIRAKLRRAFVIKKKKVYSKVHISYNSRR